MSGTAAHTATRSVALRGLYAVTPDESDNSAPAAKVSAALDGGAQIVQYPNKTADQRMRHGQAVVLLTVCRARGVPLRLLRAARAALTIPVAAIGGIAAANAAMLIAAGADSVAVISALLAASDVEAAARRIAAQFSAQR